MSTSNKGLFGEEARRREIEAKAARRREDLGVEEREE
jgi:hypothetical protein